LVPVALTGAVMDRLTHRVHILEANGESYRLTDAKGRLKRKQQLDENLQIQS
jgi:DNA replication protein DnaC